MIKGRGRKGHKTGRTEHEQPRSGGEWIYGVNPVLEALRAGRHIISVQISGSRREGVEAIERELKLRGLSARVVDQTFFDSKFPKGHQGIAALAAPRERIGLEELFEIPNTKRQPPFFIVLDCIEDPRNVGAILRSADAAGVHGVIMQTYRSAGLGPEAVKTSAGASEHMPIAIVSNIKHAMRAAKEAGMFVVGAEAGADSAPWDIDLTMPLALVVGSEGQGLRRTVREQCDLLVSLPVMGSVNSLNVSVAAGVILYEILRQRMKSNIG